MRVEKQVLEVFERFERETRQRNSMRSLGKALRELGEEKIDTLPEQ